MRRVIFKRKSSFVACLATANLFCSNENGNVILDGKRWIGIGPVKNGKEVTFEIPETEVVLTVSFWSGYNLATIIVPSGTKDVLVAGKCHLVWWGNPFRFDLVEEI